MAIESWQKDDRPVDHWILASSKFQIVNLQLQKAGRNWLLGGLRRCNLFFRRFRGWMCGCFSGGKFSRFGRDYSTKDH